MTTRFAVDKHSPLLLAAHGVTLTVLSPTENTTHVLWLTFVDFEYFVGTQADLESQFSSAVWVQGMKLSLWDFGVSSFTC